MVDEDKNCLSYWYPKIADVVPTPATYVFKSDSLDWILDPPFGETKERVEVLQDLTKKIQYATFMVGGPPAFFRTGLLSAKHGWEETCFFSGNRSIQQHIYNLVESSHLYSMFGLSTDVWVVREMLQSKPLFVAFQGMPITREFRCFVEDGRVVCFQPYWPSKAIEGHVKECRDWRPKLIEASALRDDERSEIGLLASKCGERLGGKWSVDVLETEDGWYVIDLALAEASWGYKDENGWPIDEDGHRLLVDENGNRIECERKQDGEEESRGGDPDRAGNQGRLEEEATGPRLE